MAVRDTDAIGRGQTARAAAADQTAAATADRRRNGALVATVVGQTIAASADGSRRPVGRDGPVGVDARTRSIRISAEATWRDAAGRTGAKSVRAEGETAVAAVRGCRTGNGDKSFPDKRRVDLAVRFGSGRPTTALRRSLQVCPLCRGDDRQFVVFINVRSACRCYYHKIYYRIIAIS